MPSAIETSSLPVIDISPFLSQSSDASSLAAARAQVGKQVHEACLRFGFFYINGLESVVSKQDMDDILATARAFFALPEEKKAQLAIQPGDGARGWQKLGLNVTQYKGEMRYHTRALSEALFSTSLHSHPSGPTKVLISFG